jgi:hypothetical protein
MDTNMRKPVPVSTKLTIALRFLASVDSCKCLKFLLFSPNTGSSQKINRGIEITHQSK